MAYVHLMEALGTLGGGTRPISQNHQPLEPPIVLKWPPFQSVLPVSDRCRTVLGGLSENRHSVTET